MAGPYATMLLGEWARRWCRLSVLAGRPPDGETGMPAATTARTAAAPFEQLLVGAGGAVLYVVDRRELLGAVDVGHLVDRVHPGGSGYTLVVDRLERVLRWLVRRRS